MWVATRYGFFSIVVARGEGVPRGALAVRARSREDLERLIEAIGIGGEIQVWPTADYLFRTFVSRDDAARLLAGLARDVDYQNFKDEVRVSPGQSEKLPAYHALWGALLRLQDRREEPPPDDGDEAWGPDSLFGP